MASSSNRDQIFDSTAQNLCSSGNVSYMENNGLFKRVCDSSSYDMVEELIEDHSFKPYAGQRFKDIESCFSFYTEYGVQGGFNVRKSTQKVKNKIVVTKYLVCQKAGHYDPSGPKDSGGTSESSHTSGNIGEEVKRRNTVTKKCHCNAKVILKYVCDCTYIISCFIEGHNHLLVSESGKEFLRANRTMTSFQRQFILDDAKSNIGAYRAHGIYNSLFGLYSDVGPTAKNFQNWMRDIKLYIGKHDADMLLQKFKNEKETSDGGFFYEYQTNSDGHLTRLFWADVRGRRNYEVFGDVVSFDATYRTNKYGMVFVPFIGVDNHWKSVTFASALLNHENETNFTWACEMVLKVFGRPPKCIITDQCLAMKTAISKVFPDCIHRYCMWHIMQKFPAKVGPVFCAESGFMEKLNKFVWSSHLTVAEFESGWDTVLKEFGLSEHVWLNEIYAMRKSWIPAFFRDKPMGALLRTT
ncbi:protein FAR1-RELATED SEQUENCE 5-like [Apium graveolens]|uniref:protein FAR1-RELATED SEQUENCE 5-like n=1 Tax=Apium graveolens TaxID=4045 RepID=UPI003D7A4119